MVATLPSTGIFAITRTKILLLALLIACWSIANILPHYQNTIQTRIKSQLAATRQKIPKIKISFNPNTDPRTKYNQTKLAVLIEGRAQPELVPHILHMIAVVPQDWRFLFVGSNKSVVSVGRSVPIKYQQAAGKLDLMIMDGGAEDGGVGEWDISNKEGVWRMLTDLNFYETVMPDVEWMLKFESDSIMCANSDQSLNDWLDYDWAAAPRTADDKFAGNGGLSIRRLSAVKRILGFQKREHDTQPEDEWFGKRIISMPDLKVATGAQASHFAVEDVYHEKPMGYHLRNGVGHLPEDVWKNHQQRKDIFAYCPDISIILPMKLERERCKEDDKEGNFIKMEGLGEAPSEGEADKNERDGEGGAAAVSLEDRIEQLRAATEAKAAANGETDGGEVVVEAEAEAEAEADPVDEE